MLQWYYYYSRKHIGVCKIKESRKRERERKKEGKEAKVVHYPQQKVNEDIDQFN